MSKKVLVPVADGTEELEAVSVIDILRRAGAHVTVASVGELRITASRGLKIEADALIRDCLDVDWDLVVVPGGLPGSEHLRDSGELEAILKKQAASDRPYAAICAAPVVVLQHHGLLAGRRATAYPGFSDRLEDASAAEQRVVVDGQVATSRGAGTALEFALTLVDMLFGPAKADEVAASVVARPLTRE